TTRADPRNLPYRQIGTAIEQDQVQEVLGRLNHAGPLEGLILARQVRALGRQLLSELRILASNLLKWHGSLLSSLDSRRETFCHFFQHFTAYLGAYGVIPPPPPYHPAGRGRPSSAPEQIRSVQPCTRRDTSAAP